MATTIVIHISSNGHVMQTVLSQLAHLSVSKKLNSLQAISRLSFTQSSLRNRNHRNPVPHRLLKSGQEIQNIDFSDIPRVVRAQGLHVEVGNVAAHDDIGRLENWPEFGQILLEKTLELPF